MSGFVAREGSKRLVRRRTTTWGALVIIAVLGLALISWLAFVGNNSRTQIEADQAWTSLMSSGPAIPRKEGETSLTHFLRQVETSDIRRRDLGIQFWKQFPDDSRRYEWLVLTVSMPPHYADSPDEWAQQEANGGPNGSAIRKQARDKWDALYRTMRAEFWKAKGVTDNDRQALWHGELAEEIRRLEDSHARGETIDARPVMDNILRFIANLSSAFSGGAEFEAALHGQLVNSPVNALVRAYNGGLPINSDAWNYFAEGLRKTNDTYARGLSARMQQELTKTGTPGSFLPQASTPNDAAWIRTNEAAEFPFSEKLPVVAAYRRAISDRKRMALGLELIRSRPGESLERQMEWFRLANLNTQRDVAFSRDFVRAISGRSTEQDQAAVAEWDKDYSNARSLFFANEKLPDSWRGLVRSYELMRAFDDAKKKWKQFRDRGPGLALLADIWKNHDDFRYFDRDLFYFIVRDYKALGLSDGDLLAFSRRASSLNDEATNRVAEGAINQIALNRVPFDFRAPTLDGKSFDLADLRGKIVLVDLWATSCSSCIAAMPRIHETYLRFKNRGFEVVSISFDGVKNAKRVERIEQELGLSWTTLAADDQWKSVSNRFGYDGFPQYLLLNRDGTVYARTGEIDMGRNLDRLLEEMLAKEVKK
jgi:peroxiredoxin